MILKIFSMKKIIVIFVSSVALHVISIYNDIFATGYAKSKPPQWLLPTFPGHFAETAEFHPRYRLLNKLLFSFFHNTCSVQGFLSTVYKNIWF